MPAPEGTQESRIFIPDKLSKVAAASVGPEGVGVRQWLVLKYYGKLDWRSQLANLEVKLGPPFEIRRRDSGKALPWRVDCDDEPNKLLPLRPTSPGAHTLLPAGRVAAVVHIGVNLDPSVVQISASNVDDADESFKVLKGLPPALQSEVLPMGYWRQRRLPDNEALNQLRLKIYDVDALPGRLGSRRINGRFLDSPKCELAAERLGMQASSKAVHYILGGVREDSKWAYLTEADIFPMEVRTESLMPPDVVETKTEESKEPVDRKQSLDEYRKRRMETVDAYGTAKKQRLAKSVAAGQLDDSRVAGLDANMNELRARAKTVELSADASPEQQDLLMRRKVLPPFDETAHEPIAIYAGGLEQIAVSQFIDEEADYNFEPLEKLLQISPQRILCLSRDELIQQCGGAAVVAIVLCRANAGLQETTQTAEPMARRMNIVNILCRLYKEYSKRISAKKFYKLIHVCRCVGLSETSQLSLHWFRTFFDQELSESTRKFNPNRMACHLVVWMLYLTPSLQLDFSLLQEQLSLSAARTREILQYVGCSCTSKMVAGSDPELVAQLKAPLKFGIPKSSGRKQKS
eukprot:CAMPEP_0194516708 /NCGR_PEP_ID=MMETSP0253-20130528/49662_1 /TAXON_ID=2966 /ORGANISM="Noctiluca scintillans" /LENGTH=575 /DNA_ID=CAMNT_0039360599 /DNA_START=5 /DNA_END=1732 /DNA_ORIENTATION=-